MATNPASILVTGGAGYIGSHTCVALLEAGYQVVVYDNFCNSQPESIRRVRRITGGSIELVEGDVRDQSRLEATLKAHACQSVIHFAGLKAVGESVEKPLEYYDNNVVGSYRLLAAMQAVGINRFVFSSSATVYGDPQFLPYTESHPLAPTNPYGRTKRMVEDMLRDLFHSDPRWKIAILRYFNPVGAHASGLIGEDPLGIPNNLMPFIAQVAVGRREQLNVWGNDYPTPDGTGVRDYIHVMDLAEGHVSALRRLAEPACLEINLGTGQGYSVLDMVRAFEQASGKTIPLSFAPRRPGDVASSYADPRQAEALLGWRARHGIEAICEDHWRWQRNNPQGYAG